MTTMVTSWKLAGRFVARQGPMLRRFPPAERRAILCRSLSTGNAPSAANLAERTSDLVNFSSVWSQAHVSKAKHMLRSLHHAPSPVAVKQGVQVLNRWIDESTNHEISCSGLLDMLKLILNCLKDSEESSFSEALELVNKMEGLPDETQRPDAKSFTMVMNMLSDADNVDKGLAEDLFQRAVKTKRGQEDAILWCSYLHILASRSASDEAEDILKEMIRLEIADHMSYSIVMNALAKNGLPARAQSLLRRMIDMDMHVTETMFNTCLHGFAKQGNGKEAEILLQTMVKQEIQPNEITFCSVINAWAKSKDPTAFERAEQLLASMESMGCHPTTVTYTATIDALAQSKNPTAAKRAHELLRHMERECSRGNDQACPNVASYTSAIHALANSRDSQAAEEAVNILRRMRKIADSGRVGFTVNKVAYSAVIDVVAKSRSPKAPQQALALLRDMQTRAEVEGLQVAPNTVSFNTVIAAFGNRGDAITAASLLDEMKKEAEQGNVDVVPDTVSYCSVLNAYSKRKNPNSPQQALRLLSEMEREHQSGNSNVKPNTVAYSSVIASLVHSRSRGAPEQAEALLKQMKDLYRKGNEDVKPNSMTLGAVLQVWSVSGEAAAPERAMALIRWAEAEYKEGNHELKVNRICYNYLLATWAKSGRREALDRVKKLLKGMSLADDEDVKPDVHSYARLMTAIHQSRSDNAPTLQLKILKLLLDSHASGDRRLKPTAQIVHHVLTSCLPGRGQARNDPEVLTVLQEVGSIALAEEEWLPNSVTFNFFFETCYKAGLDDRSLFDQLYQASRRRNRCTKEVERSYNSLVHNST